MRHASSLRSHHGKRQVLDRLLDGYRNKQIALELGIFERTVKMHRAAILVKLEARTTAEAIRIGLASSLVIGDRGGSNG
ncbi:LuxR C-terminal-related transcriptional regulator [Variovorax davisae]|uniref:LuxR C-terminal-related transcriptional regulator n=1 Tax=Variovorax davisae TaxID=3053515 RepID=UPI0033656782